MWPILGRNQDKHTARSEFFSVADGTAGIPVPLLGLVDDRLELVRVILPRMQGIELAGKACTNGHLDLGRAGYQSFPGDFDVRDSIRSEGPAGQSCLKGVPAPIIGAMPYQSVFL